MRGVAELARAAGHRVTGSDQNVGSDERKQLADLGVDVHSGYDAEQFFPEPDCVLVGRTPGRGVPAVEAMLDKGLRYESAAGWLARHALGDQHVIAVAGTHGKTTTASLLAWLLDAHGQDPGFLIGGVPVNFGTGARTGAGRCFVIEADEAETAFFDARAQFLHYRPQTLVLTNLEFEHADVYADLDALRQQFHGLVRTVPGAGLLVMNGGDRELASTLGMGCWTRVERFGIRPGNDWLGEFVDGAQRHVSVKAPDGALADTRWTLAGSHNLENVTAAVAAAVHAGVPFDRAVAAVSGFLGVKRRLERTATVGDIAVYDDLAQHPTAIRRTLEGLKRAEPGRRIVAALEPRSATLRLGHHNAALADSLSLAESVYVYAPADVGDGFRGALAPLGARCVLESDYDALVSRMAPALAAGDLVVFMSDGRFGDARQTLTALLRRLKSER